MNPSLRYCTQCAHELVRQIPPGDNLARDVCPACGHIHYLNPKLVVGCVPEWQGQILLCRRAIEPRLGYWTVPAGFMENGESAEQAAARETREEAEAAVEILSPVALVSVPRIGQVHLLFRAKLIDGQFGVGPESLESRLVAEADIPWDELAFPSIRFALECYFADRAAGQDGMHITSVADLRS